MRNTSQSGKPAPPDPALVKSLQLNVGAASVYSYAFSADGTRAVTGHDDNTVRYWDLETGNCLQVLKGHRDDVRSVALSADGRRALSGCDDGTVRLWDLETGNCLRVLKGHADWVRTVACSADGSRALAGSDDQTVYLWDLETGNSLQVLEGHSGWVFSVAFSPDQCRALSGSRDNTIRLWDLETGNCLRVLEGHTSSVFSVALSPDQRRAITGSIDNTARLWDLETGNCLRVLEGHTNCVNSVACGADERFALSGSDDSTVRLWDLETGNCLHVLEGHQSDVMTVAWSTDENFAFSGDIGGDVRVWDLSELIAEARSQTADRRPLVTAPAPDQVQYANAKVLLVGDTHSGKTGLAHRLATGEYRPSEASTVGAWSTQWNLPTVTAKEGWEQEIWLWDFGGQADQRLIHQLYMDRTALILLLFNADEEDVLPGLRDWLVALGRSVAANTPRLLVAGRVDAGFRASRTKLRAFAKENGMEYHETSAKEGQGIEELIRAIDTAIPWDKMERRTSPLIFKLIRDAILKLRDEGDVLFTFNELREAIRQRLPTGHPYTDEVLSTVISLLDGPGAVRELDYGTYILLQPEWINAYAQAVIRTLRQQPDELGALPLTSIGQGKLLFQTVDREGGVAEMKRLPEAAERVVLREMERQLEERGLCLRQGDKLVFPSHCGRDRPAIPTAPSFFVSYAVRGYLDDIYATLVVALADSKAFRLEELWRDAADFQTLDGNHHMGVKLSREAAGVGEISVYFGPEVTPQEQVIFANYIHTHLLARAESACRLRHYVCPHCHTPKGNPQVLMQKLFVKKKQARAVCDNCDKSFELWDELERLFASEDVRAEVEGLQAIDAIRLDTRRKGKLLALEVMARITSTDQKCFEIPGTEDEGIDVELEFTEDDGKGSGKRLYLQLKCGNSYLRKRESDGAEIFRIKKRAWVDYWLKQPCPVMLVIGTFPEDERGLAGKDKLEFDQVRWMEISEYLRRESDGGKKPVKQIVFTGERFDLASIQRMRDMVLAEK